MGAIVGRVARSTGAAVLGTLLGFFVAASIFADGDWGERLPTIGALLLAYFLGGVALGYRASWWYGAILALPGLAVMAYFATGNEGHWWYLPYAGLVAALSVAGAYGVGRR